MRTILGPEAIARAICWRLGANGLTHWVWFPRTGTATFRLTRALEAALLSHEEHDASAGGHLFGPVHIPTRPRPAVEGLPPFPQRRLGKARRTMRINSAAAVSFSCID